MKKIIYKFDFKIFLQQVQKMTPDTCGQGEEKDSLGYKLKKKMCKPN